MTDELEILRAWTPPGEPAPDTAAVAARARAHLHAHLAAPPRRARRRRLLVTVPALTAAAALVAVLVLALDTSRVAPQRHPYATGPTTAAAALEQAAHAAETAAPAFPDPSQFFYIRTISTDRNCRVRYCALLTSRREVWGSVARRGEIRTTHLGVSWPSEDERRDWVKAGRPRLPTTGIGVTDVPARRVYDLGPQLLSTKQVRDFEESGADLYRRLYDPEVKRIGASEAADEVWVWISATLAREPTTPKLRAALLRALALVPGIRFDAHAHDRLGRPGFMISRVDGALRDDFVFDPKTSALLGEREVVAAPNAFGPVGTVNADVAYERMGVVDAIGQKP